VYLDERIKASFKQLLFRSKHKAITCIQSLKDTNGKQSYNAKARLFLKKRLYFGHLNATIRKNCEAWIRRNDLHFYNLNKPTFKLGGTENE
jgi:hypothetical protein